MGYRDDFYVTHNVVGYTGSLTERDKVTVYFRNGHQFGRITQAHRDPRNIGRSRVRQYNDYKIIYNLAKARSEEFYDGSVQHVSRHHFCAVSQEETHTLSLLAEIIRAHAECKPKVRADDVRTFARLLHIACSE